MTEKAKPAARSALLSAACMLIATAAPRSAGAAEEVAVAIVPAEGKRAPSEAVVARLEVML